jgi:DNA repair protein RAD16
MSLISAPKSSVSTPLQRKGKGKGLVKSTPATPSEDGNASIVSEAQLEYDEDAEIDESEDSGSEFEAESDSEDDVPAPRYRRAAQRRELSSPESDDDEEADEELMVDAAIQMSLQTARLDVSSSGGAGPSSRPKLSASRAAAAAAERRLARSKKGVDDLEFDAATLETESEAMSSESEPLLEAKGKGKKKKQSAKIRDTSAATSMTFTELQTKRREDRRRALAARQANKVEERALAKKLGRKLTWVCLKYECNSHVPYFSSRRRKLQLHFISTTKSLEMFGATWKRA